MQPDSQITTIKHEYNIKPVNYVQCPYNNYSTINNINIIPG